MDNAVKHTCKFVRTHREISGLLIRVGFRAGRRHIKHRPERKKGEHIRQQAVSSVFVQNRQEEEGGMMKWQ